MGVRDLPGQARDAYPRKGEPVLVDTTTGTSTVVKSIPAAAEIAPVAWVNPLSCFLVARARAGSMMSTADGFLDGEWSDAKSAGPARPEFYLLDPVHGSARPASGEMRPWLHSLNRMLQPATGDDCWAAIPDRDATATRVGLFNTRTFLFCPVARLPGILLESQDMWVDEAASVIYAVHAGDVLRLPFPRMKTSGSAVE
jgi:hypothetical protein